jgi:hypothetical protein
MDATLLFQKHEVIAYQVVARAGHNSMPCALAARLVKLPPQADTSNGLSYYLCKERVTSARARHQGVGTLRVPAGAALDRVRRSGSAAHKQSLTRLPRHTASNNAALRYSRGERIPSSL